MRGYSRPRRFSSGSSLASRPRKARNDSSGSRLLPRDEQLGPEAVAVGPGQAAVLLEPLDGVGVQHLAPDVGVVAGGVRRRRRCAGSSRCGSAAGSGRGPRPAAASALASNASDVVRDRRLPSSDVPRLVEQRRAEVLGGARSPRPRAAASSSRSTTSWRQRLAGRVVPGVVGQDLRPEDPHLVDLRGVLHEVAGHARCRRTAGTSRRRTARAGRGRTRGTWCGPRRGSAAWARRRAAWRC